MGKESNHPLTSFDTSEADDRLKAAAQHFLKIHLGLFFATSDQED